MSPKKLPDTLTCEMPTPGHSSRRPFFPSVPAYARLAPNDVPVCSESNVPEHFPRPPTPPALLHGFRFMARWLGFMHSDSLSGTYPRHRVHREQQKNPARTT